MNGKTPACFGSAALFLALILASSGFRSMNWQSIEFLKLIGMKDKTTKMRAKLK